jgi:hypothetical protein
MAKKLPTPPKPPKAPIPIGRMKPIEKPVSRSEAKANARALKAAQGPSLAKGKQAAAAEERRLDERADVKRIAKNDFGPGTRAEKYSAAARKVNTQVEANKPVFDTSVKRRVSPLSGRPVGETGRVGGATGVDLGGGLPDRIK